MSKRNSLPPVFIMFLAALVLSVVSSSAFAENRGAGLRQVTDYVHRCDVPYNIQDYGYTTGLHILPDWTSDLTFTFKFYCGGEPYATVTKTIGPEGWTGTASQLLGGDLLYPTLIIAFSQ